MIVISFLLVIVAAVTLIIGLFQDDLGWIWASIASCVLAMVFLGIGVLQRRGAPATAGASSADDEDEYSSGAVAGVIGGRDGGDEPRGEAITVVPKRTVADARQAIAESEPSVEEAAASATVVSRPSVTDEDTVEVEQQPAAADKRTAKKSTKKTAKKSAKKTAKKSTKKAAKKSTKKTAKKSTKKTAKKTTGAAARDRLAQISGVGEAKADALLSRFGSLEAVRDADVDDLTSVKGIGGATAAKLRDEL